MGGRIQIPSLVARLAARYLLVFAIVLAALSGGAYLFLAREYAALLLPALATPEGSRAYHAAMARVALTIVAFDLPLLAIVGMASWWLARASLSPLITSRERERAFAADAAHELRSPLATIAAVAQAARPQAAPPVASALDRIVRESLDASELVGELLTLARNAGPALLHRERVDLAEIFEHVADDFRSAAGERAVALRVQSTHAFVDGDERRLRELARNLLANAVRHAKSMVTVLFQHNARTIEVTVANDGEPIAAEAQERIFERFYRLSADGEGSGLGLAIVRWIAEAHGGAASVKNANDGPVFSIRLPAA